MKQVILLVAVVTGSLGVQAQKKGAKKNAAPSKSTTENISLKTSLDSVSYALGASVGQFLKAQDVTSVNYAMLNSAIAATMKGEKALLDMNQCNSIMQTLAQKGQEKAQAARQASAVQEKEKGKQWLAQNKTRPGVIETPSGLQYEIITKGTGAIPTKSDTVVAHYRGTLTDGKEFDNSYSRNEPLTIPVGSVIPGWTEALQMMPVGSKWKLYIPSSIGYGDNGAGQEIPGGATLVFEVELLSIKGK